MMEINWNRFVVLLLPLRMRVATVFSFIRSVLAPIVYLFNLLRTYESDIRYKLAHTSQVWSIEAVLNDAFDIELRRIYISDAGGDTITLIHRDSDNDPLVLDADEYGAFIMQNDSAYFGGSYDFIVNIPYQFSDASLYRLRALVDYYKLAGKRYDVVVN
ncbi:hypothetical protein [Carboxylicivirga linearis]|uniref:Uncharacterized protein n=1 Tax=Carboxylicivirga linearis TaxID=1628157 RepID=A0ABS5JWJ0_9BACT|nr:hypothetical protein [Carboxylicivirga linearis]MBS2099199.1 hypothetical protein [Carboxylicivirga linearis]